jgi:hypothetical protein
VIAVRGRQQAAQSFMNWNCELGFGFLLSNADGIAEEIGPQHPVNIRSTLSRV